MSEHHNSAVKLRASLQKRAAELECLCTVEEILSDYDKPVAEACAELIEALPCGWTHSDLCRVQIRLENDNYQSESFVETEWCLSSDVVVQDTVAGAMVICYAEEPPTDNGDIFLEQEERLLDTVAERLSFFVTHQRMRQVMQELEHLKLYDRNLDRGTWQVILEVLRKTDKHLYVNVSQRMLYHLCLMGIAEAEQLNQSWGVDQLAAEAVEARHGEDTDKRWWMSPDLSSTTFKIASRHLSDGEILELVERWIREDKLSFLSQVVNRNLSLAEVVDAIRRYLYSAPGKLDSLTAGMRGIQVSLIRRLLSDQSQYINVAKNFISISDIHELIQNVVYGPESQGKLGGKSAGLYLAGRILEEKSRGSEILSGLKTPKTWYITSDVLPYFLRYHNLGNVVEQKYKGLSQVRLEYPHLVRTFRSARFPEDILKSLSAMLDEFGDAPLVVRSSSLLEDRIGVVFSGKYRSVFVPNQGSKKKRLAGLTDAIAEVYASTFSPDPIAFRTKRGLLDFAEEMGIMIQEVVGTRIDEFFLPTFSGTALCINKLGRFPYIKRQDGLLKLVPGLGSRVRQQVHGDQPVLAIPGKTARRVTATTPEILEICPKHLDVINLETNRVVGLHLDEFLQKYGDRIPGIENVVSVLKNGELVKPRGGKIDYAKDTLVATFDGLLSRTEDVPRLHLVMRTLEETLGAPVEVKFTSDGKDLYLIQCRHQTG
ncbi:MAG: PEP/pyruvate-binding domain-containing protein [candidate division Zixibacteria bacterium]|nr:PEP/pyruvate-binding domain-containing protein [candidate division Zixibacteria bacterium]